MIMMNVVNLRSAPVMGSECRETIKSPNVVKKSSGVMSEEILFKAVKFVIIDASNIARTNCISGEMKGAFRKVVKLYKKLSKINPNLEILIIADANLRYLINDQRVFEEYYRSGKLHIAPAGTEADFFILKFAQTHPNSVIISNDRFKEFARWFHEACKRRIPFMIIKDEIILYQKTEERL